MNTEANRIDRRFAALREQGRKALIPYITAGHPSPESSVALMRELVAAGADLLELGVPFSDVMADGPVIQNACRRALKQGMTLDRVFDMVRRFRSDDPDTPVILMGYMNPIERRGLERFAADAAEAGVDALLVVDCPADEAEETAAVFGRHGMHQIFLAAPTTTPARVDRLVKLAGGFIYYVSLKGVTGSAALDAASLAPALAVLRERSALPLAVGFGIATPEQAAAVAGHADAVVIGSALVKRLDHAESVDQARAIASDYLIPVREALDASESTHSIGAATA